MSRIDDYMKDTPSAQRTELERIRTIALRLLPGAEETISYGMPTIKYRGKAVIGFDAHTNHIGVYPYSGSVIAAIEELSAYDTTKAAIREKPDHLLPESLIEKIIRKRLEQIN